MKLQVLDGGPRCPDPFARQGLLTSATTTEEQRDFFNKLDEESKVRYIKQLEPLHFLPHEYLW